MKGHEQAGRPAAVPPTGVLVDVTATLQKLNQAGSLGSNQMQVSLVPVPYAGRQAAGEHMNTIVR